MEILTVILLIIIATWISYVAYILLRKEDTKPLEEKIQFLENEKNRILEEKIRLESDLVKKTEDFGGISVEIKTVATERDELSGKNKTLFVEKMNLLNDRKNLEEENRLLKDKIAKNEAEETRKTKEFDTRIQKLDDSKKALEEERIRIQRNDEEEQKRIFDEKNRIWNDHENLVLARSRETCQKPSIGFTFYDNTNLPSEFTKLKPDFMVSFLDQYIIFDAKKSKDIKTYIPEQVKSAARKYKNMPEIYSAIFFIVPDDEIQELKSLSFVEDRFSFYIVTTDALEPLLANFKKITEYERIEELDPQDRENIVNIIAQYDRHISLQNATNILFAKDSIELMNKKESLNGKLLSEIEIKKQEMRTLKLKDSDIKKVAQSISEQAREIWNLISPKVAIERIEMDNISTSLKD
jgi:hypothetical protein